MLIYHRTPALLEMGLECINSIPQRADQEIIVVDNGSTVRHDWECDTYIRLNKNFGISHGWNLGLKAARGKYLVIIGDDIIVRDGWLECMREAMDMPDAGMANPRVEGLPGGMGIQENYRWPSGACFMLTRNTIDKVGYFDEDRYFPAQFEDTDYWVRLMGKGLKIYTNFSKTIRHKEGQTDKAPDISVHFEANKKRFIDRHGFDPIPYFYGTEEISELFKKIRT
jgi:GT2 family glycosyltransferase